MLDSGRVQEMLRQCGTNARAFVAPGRVNLIGEHTDYNDGFVLPMAIERQTVICAARRQDTKVSIRTCTLGQSAEFDLDAPSASRRGSWLDYVEGIARVLMTRGHRVKGADLLLDSDIPTGAGLSSSAALEVGVGRALLALADIELDGKELALAAQAAEHEYVGTRCGIMDQYACALAQEGQAMLIDCRTLEASWVPLDRGADVRIVIADTKVKHELSGSEYNVRRAECEEGVAQLARRLPNILALRDVGRESLARYENELSPVVRRRCRHVVSENERTLGAAKALERGDYAAFGRAMFESHLSLRDDYEVSAPELDVLVDAAREVDGVFGSRMTGGGFGGCTVSLVSAGAVEEFCRVSCEALERRFRRTPEIFVTRASRGVHELTFG